MDPTHPADPTAEAFARHAAWLRRLARGLLYERADADDLVQSAWLAALRRGPNERESQGAWLAGAVRRLASQSARESARRARRERAAARPEAFRDPTSALERLELTQLLVEAVRALDEPYRTTLLWRFFDGLSVRAIAKRRGVPLETARTHVKRGLELVRRRLDGRGPGARAELLAALVPLAGPVPGALGLAGPAVGKVLLETAGAVGMSTKLGLSVVGVVVAALALWTIQATSDERAKDARADGGAVALDEAVREVPVSPTAAAEPLAPTAPAPATSDASQRALATDGAFVVRGRVLLTDDRPIPGARIELRLYAGASSDGEPARSELVEADAEGRFRCPLAPPEGPATLWARVAMDGYYAWPVEVGVPAGAGPPDELDLRAYPLDCTLTGRVLDPNDVPIAGVRLKGPVGETTSAPDGTYELALSSLRSSIFVDALAKGWAQERQFVVPPKAGERVTADFHLRRELRVVGRVEDEFGGPIAGAEVSSFFTHDNEATSAADGTFTLHSLDPGRAEHQVTARKEGYVRATETIETRGRDEVELVLRLPRGARVEGRVVDSEGEPLAGAELYIGFSPHAYDRLDALSAADGSFSFPSVGRGGQTLVTQLAGFASDHREIVVPEQGDVLGGVEIVLGTGRYLAGRVVDEADEAIAEVRITATHKGEYIDVSAQSDAEGRFRLEHLPDEQVGVEVYGAGIVRLEQAVAELDQEDLVLRVRRAARVAGTVVDGPTGAPLASFRIRFVRAEVREGEHEGFGYSASWVREGHLFTDGDGRWDSGGEELPPGGVIGIEASAPGYAPTVVGRAVASVGADPAALVIELWPERIVRGQLVSAASGEPVAGATLKRFTAQDPLSQYDNGDVHRRPMARTDAHGRFELRGVPAGEMSLAVEHPGHASLVDGPFEVPRDRDPAERLIELGGGVPLRGRLLDCDGRALAGQIVELQGRGALAGMGLRVEAQTDAVGAFAFEHLSEGEYAVAHIAPTSWGARVRMLELELELGRDAELELRADGDASLSGGIESEEELPGDFAINAQRVQAESGGPSAPLALGAISSGARFEICGLPAGEYEVYASRWDQGTGHNWFGHARVQVEAGKRAELWIRVSPNR